MEGAMEGSKYYKWKGEQLGWPDLCCCSHPFRLTENHSRSVTGTGSGIESEFEFHPESIEDDDPFLHQGEDLD